MTFEGSVTITTKKEKAGRKEERENKLELAFLFSKAMFYK